MAGSEADDIFDLLCEIDGFNEFSMLDVTSWAHFNNLHINKTAKLLHSSFDDQCRRALRRERLLRDRQNPLQLLSPEECRKKVRIH